MKYPDISIAKTKLIISILFIIIFYSFESFAKDVYYKLLQSEADEANKLYYQCDGENWRFKGGWPLSTNVFTNIVFESEGVDYFITDEVFSENSKKIVYKASIRGIELPFNALEGIIPDINLPFLEVLNLSGNKLSGNLPSFNLPKLIELNLYRNQLTGTIPNFNLPLLEKLILDENQLSGNLNNCIMPNLVWIKLSNNLLTDTIPNFNMPSLFTLELSGNQLKGNIPNFNLPNLKILDLSDNNITGKIPDFNLPKLFKIDLSGNSFSFEALEVNLNKYTIYEYNYQDYVLPINQTGDILSVIDDASANTYQWKFNGYGIEGANNKQIKANKKGFYRCTVNNTSLPGLTLETDNYEINKLSVNEELNKKVILLQDSKELKIINNSNKKIHSINIHNLKGDLVFSTTEVNNIIDLSNHSKSIYFASLNLGSEIITKKIILNQ